MRVKRKNQKRGKENQEGNIVREERRSDRVSYVVSNSKRKF